MLVVRPIELPDVPAAARIHVDTWRSTYRGLIDQSYLDGLSYETKAAQWKQGIENNAADIFRYVAEIDGRLVGIAIFGSLRNADKPDHAELYALYVSDDAQRKGAGYALWDKSIEVLRQRGYRKMIIRVLEGNTKGIEFYVRQGARFMGHDAIELDGSPYDHRNYEFALRGIA